MPVLKSITIDGQKFELPEGGGGTQTPEVINVVEATWFPTSTKIATIDEDVYNNKIVYAVLELNQDNDYELTINAQENCEMYITFKSKGPNSTNFNLEFNSKNDKLVVLDVAFPTWVNGGWDYPTMTKVKPFVYDISQFELYVIKAIWKNGFLTLLLSQTFEQ
jgi:hypothetical protein